MHDNAGMIAERLPEKRYENQEKRQKRNRQLCTVQKRAGDEDKARFVLFCIPYVTSISVGLVFPRRVSWHRHAFYSNRPTSKADGRFRNKPVPRKRVVCNDHTDWNYQAAVDVHNVYFAAK